MVDVIHQLLVLIGLIFQLLIRMVMLLALADITVQTVGIVRLSIILYQNITMQKVIQPQVIHLYGSHYVLQEIHEDISIL